MSTEKLQLSSPFATGGGGVVFETRVQAAFAVLMLAGGGAPCLRPGKITRIKLQGRHEGFETDDLIVFQKCGTGSGEARLLVQVKHQIAMTKSSREFSEVIGAAWRDFTNPDVFSADTDCLALVTGPLSKTDLEMRDVLELARYSQSAEDFLRIVEKAKLCSGPKREKLAALRYHLDSANGGKPVTDDELWRFLRRYHLLAYDLDVEYGASRSLLICLIGQYSSAQPSDVWRHICDFVAHANPRAGTIVRDLFPQEVLDCFERRETVTMPDELVSEHPDMADVDWNRETFASDLVVALLLGGWDDGSKGDIPIVEKLAEKGFGEWSHGIHEALQRPNAPLLLRDGVWTVQRKKEMWVLLGSRVFDPHLERFREIAVEVLAESDPKFGLPPDEMHMANLRGAVLTRSAALRRGLAETLALLTSEAGALPHCSQGKAEAISFVSVRGILKEANWELWATLDGILPTLAEASPAAFLDAVEGALGTTPCPFVALYELEEVGVFGRNYTAGLLWALETLAWDEEYLTRVTAILGELCSVDPGGGWSNRPANSLTTIFLPWLPQTLAAPERRRAAVESLVRESPECAWKLLLSLLPNQTNASSGCRKPKWRMSLPEDCGKGSTRVQYWADVSSYAHMAVSMAAEETGRLLELLEYLDDVPPPAFSALLEMLRERGTVELPSRERVGIWSALSRVLAKHRRYSDAEWALPSEVLEEVDEVASLFTPEDPIELHKRLFSDRAIDLLERDDDWKVAEKKLVQHRRAALLKILKAQGASGLLELVRVAESPRQVGLALGPIADSDTQSAFLPTLLDSEEGSMMEFVGALVSSRYQELHEEWLDEFDFSSWSSKQVGRFLSALPFCRATWERAEKLMGKRKGDYWSRVPVNPFQADGALDTAVGELLKHERPYAAIDCLTGQLTEGESLNSALAIEALKAAVSSKEQVHSLDGYRVTELLKALQEDPAVDEEGLLSVEWAYLGLLGMASDAYPRTLERRLSSDPLFFCQVVRFLYCSDDEDSERETVTEELRAKAQKAFRLLSKWKTPPGTLSKDGFSEKCFSLWLRTVCAECEKTGHLHVALSHTGQVLVHAPEDPDGLWIHRAIADILNAKNSQEMRNGLEMGYINSLGVRRVGPEAKSEKELAAKYRRRAGEAEDAGYPRLAATMRGLAEFYQSEAERIAADLCARHSD